MATVFLALGSNVGDSGQFIARAVTMLSEQLTALTQAPVYRSKAVGYTDQPDFLNTAIMAETALSYVDLLAHCQSVEQRLGRVRRFKWGPREIDIDIIFYDDQVVSLPDLQVPHPEYRNRDFVLRPLSDLAPDFMDPVVHKTVSQLLQELPDDQKSLGCG